jgi:DNA-binding response OmpR family regulator
VGSPGDVARSVLIIEDDDRIRRIVSITLRREGLEVTEARSGEEGLAALAERPHDLVLLDLVLPGRSGLEVCREIRRVSTTPVIMVTARADSADVIAGLEAGADDYVTKPFVAAELSARIRALARRAGTTGPRPRIVVGDL